VRTFAIVTTDANALVTDIHERMLRDEVIPSRVHANVADLNARQQAREMTIPSIVEPIALATSATQSSRFLCFECGARCKLLTLIALSACRSCGVVTAKFLAKRLHCAARRRSLPALQSMSPKSASYPASCQVPCEAPQLLALYRMRAPHYVLPDCFAA
jgi:hypothetical protein